MAIGLTAKQKQDLAAMLPNVEDSVASLKRLIADAKDRTKALARLDEAEQAQRRHATDVGIPFNADAFARRRAELNAVPKMLTVEEGQLASFSALQRAIGVLLDGPYTREGRRGSSATAGRSARKPPGRTTGTTAGKTAGRGAGKKAGTGKRALTPARKSGSIAAPKSVKPTKPAGGSSVRTGKSAVPPTPPARSAAPKSPPVKTAGAASPVSATRVPTVKPLPLALGS